MQECTVSKFEDRTCTKLKACLVADGRTQDRTLYSDYSTLTSKTRSVMMCLKLAATQESECLKVDIEGAFLCTKINDEEEVFLQLVHQMTDMVMQWMPKFLKYQGDYGAMIVKVDQAMNGIIQSPKLWYKELTIFLKQHRVRVCQADEYILY
jgi:uncharacterized protein YqkB